MSFMMSFRMKLSTVLHKQFFVLKYEDAPFLEKYCPCTFSKNHVVSFLITARLRISSIQKSRQKTGLC